MKDPYAPGFWCTVMILGTLTGALAVVVVSGVIYAMARAAWFLVVNAF